MKIRNVAASGVILAFAFSLAVPASAQTPGPAAPPSVAPSTDESRGDIDFGVNFGNWVRNRGVTSLYKKGWRAGASYRITQLISVISEVSADYRKRTGFTANRYTYAGGARFQSAVSAGFSPFAQIVLGGGQDNDDGAKRNHYPMVSPGGGMDFGMGHHAAVRLRADFPLYMTFGDVFKGARVSAGVSIPFGKR